MTKQTNLQKDVLVLNMEQQLEAYGCGDLLCAAGVCKVPDGSFG